MNAATNRYRVAPLTATDRAVTGGDCECCERTGLKKLVKLISPAGVVVWYGTGCAAKAIGCTESQVKRAQTNEEDVRSVAEAVARDAAWRAEEAKFQAWLDSKVGAGDRFSQLEKLGGYKAARASYLAG